ncbi:MAG TPA: hypothetical protein VLJ14_04240 [Ktedonobacterales bacterium]|jgi:phosphate uptake regulator|nr:hypothetical protein [Ktedonobacterales bacterium]
MDVESNADARWDVADRGVDVMFDRAERMDDEIGSLADETTELGVYAEDIFKNAAAALYERGTEAALFGLDTSRVCARLHTAIHLKGLSIIAWHAPGPDVTRRIVGLQQIAADFARIAADGGQIAEQALFFSGSAESDLLLAGGDTPLHLIELIRQTYVEVRGCVIATTTWNTAMARRLIVEDTELDRLFLSYKHALDTAIAANARGAARLQRLLLVGVHLEDIGNRVVSICRTLLYSPPGVGS